MVTPDIHALILGHFKINFTLSQVSFNDLVFGGWAFDVMKLFDK